MHPCKRTVRVLALLTVSFLLVASAALAAADENPLAFLDGLTLVTVNPTDAAGLRAARELVEAHGGRVAIMSPPSTLIGWVPAAEREALRAEPGIRGVFTSAVDPATAAPGTAPGDRAMISFFNAAVRGDLAHEEQRARASAGAAPGANRPGDALQPPPLDRDALVDNLEAMGIDAKGLGTGPNAASMGNSDDMTGTVALTVFFVESDGSGSDPDLYTWTPEHMQTYLDGVATALAFWSSRAVGHSDCSVTWLILYHSGQDPRCQQWVEPILHPAQTFEETWVDSVMTHFGYTSGSRFSRVTAYNTWQRATYLTDRAYSSFIIYNPPPAPAAFPDGYTAYAYLFGPYSVLLFNISGFSKAQVFAHESGHIFGACDEYAGACDCGTCSHGVVNGNCDTCSPSPRACMMKANDWSLCTYTGGQVGWSGPGCTPPPPPPLPAPVAVTSSPPTGLQGTKATVTVEGSNFYAGATLDFGGDVFVDVITMPDDSTIIADVTILNSAPPGPRDVSVVNRDGKRSTLPAAFEILPTFRHYYSPSGGDVFPYITPDDAATTLASAIDAAYAGDTLFVPTMTFSNFSLTLEKGVLLYGGWNANFTVRDLAGGKTDLQLAGNLSLTNTADGGGFDGFIIENGTAPHDVQPFVGRFGGGIRILDADATIANCEIRNNAAGTITEPGVGGGIYAQNAALDIRDNVFDGNAATLGGALHLRNCSGSIARNTFSANSVSAPGTLTEADGGGVMLWRCNNLTLEDNVFDTNTGAANGGGLYVHAGDNVTVSGGSFHDNTASFGGGGVSADSSVVTITGASFDSNTSTITGGGVGVSGASTLSLSSCAFDSNTAVLGGGVYASGGTATIAHNLLSGNQASGTAGGIYVGTVASGVVQGNTLDANACTATGAGGITAASTGIEIFDNIVTHSTGPGIQCSGSPAPVLSYNLVWESSGADYDGCAPGTGAVSADPLFADAAAGDYHLAVSSPAIDAGRPGGGFADGDGSRGDMGRYGSHGGPMDRPSYPKNVVVQVNAGQGTLSWSANPEPDVVGYVVYRDSASGFVPGLGNVFATTPDTTLALGAVADTTYYVVAAFDTSGYGSGYSAEVAAGAQVGTGAGDVTRYATRLVNTVPNPFNPATRILYTLATRGDVRVEIYDVAGRLVHRLVDGVQDAGPHAVEWNGTDGRGRRASSGIYFCRLVAGGVSNTRKMVLLK